MSTPIPMPSRAIVARWIVPLAILGAAVGTMIFTGLDALRPATPVRVAPVVALERAEVSFAQHRGSARSDGEATSAPAAASSREQRPPAAEQGPGQRHAAAPRPESRWIQAPGWIEPDPQPVVVSALRDGIVEEVLVLEGDTVERGAPVAVLESRAAALALARAQAELARAEAERERFVAMAEDARTEQAQLPFRRAAAQARYDAARDASDRADRLAETQAMGEAEVVRLHQAMLEAMADLETIEPRARAIAAAIRAADAEAASAVLVPKAMLDQAALDLDRSRVQAPIDGVVMEVHALPGQNLFAGDMALGRAIVTLYDPRRLRVRADVPLADAAGLAVGQQARVTVEVLPDRVFEGVVSRLVHKADIQKNTVGVKVTLIDPSPELKPDMLARVRIEVAPPRHPGTARPAAPAVHAPTARDATARDANTAAPSDPASLTATAALLARADALLGDGEERRAFVVTGVDRGRGRIESRRVRVSPESPRDGWLIALDGLSVGDALVVAPSPSIADGALVAIVETLRDPKEPPHAAR